jgi:hypothetical protein
VLRARGARLDGFRRRANALRCAVGDEAEW